jgi:hypothetical protein
MWGTGGQGQARPAARAILCTHWPRRCSDYVAHGEALAEATSEPIDSRQPAWNATVAPSTRSVFAACFDQGGEGIIGAGVGVAFRNAIGPAAAG